MIDIRQFFYVAIDTNNIEALKLLLYYGYELINLNQIIFSGHIELIQYAESLGHDMQSICNSYDFAYNSNDWIYLGVGELKVLAELNIDLSKQINNIMLHRGVFGNNLDVIKFCVELGATNLNECLDEACMENLSDIIVYLLNIGADATNISECAILYLEYDVALALIKYGYIYSMDDLYSIFIKEFTDGDDLNKFMPIFNIIGSIDFLFIIEDKYIVKSNCFTSSSGDIHSRSMDEYHKSSKLEWIVSKNKFSHVKFIVEHAFDKILPELNRLFIIAVANGHVTMMLYLLDLGADIECINNLAICAAIFFGHYPMLKILLSYGIKLDNVTHNPLMMCAYGSSVQEYKIIGYEILTTNSNVFRNDYFNIGSDYVDIFYFLIENNVVIPDRTFIEALDNKYYSVNLFTYIIQNGININSKLNVISKQSEYHLDYLLKRAVMANCTEVAELLLENGADAYIGGFVFITENEKLRKLLEEYGAII
jgi:ankyrin repeat protein